jgi:heterodisulfide reductase subunit A
MLKTKSALVIGGGIAGIQASLDLAAAGIKVNLVEREPSIGGRMAQLDKTFPTNDCSICILAPKMIECFNHKNVNVLTYSEVKSVKGRAGNFTVTILKKPRYVDENKCTGCGACSEKCPTKVPNEFDMNLSIRKAIYIPFAQAVPRVATIDEKNCVYLRKGKCKICEKVCQAKAIDYEMKPKEIELNVGAIIVATGFDVYMPYDMEEYGYGKYKNVITAMEFERLINAAGPTGGHLQRLSDDKARPKKLAFIQCVGSRDIKNDRPYCSAVCCMHATKEAMLAREHHEDMDSYVFYTDIRAFAKGFQEYTERGEREYGINYIRSKPGEIKEDPKTSNPVIYYMDTDSKKLKTLEVDMVILSTALVPSKGVKGLAEILGVELDKHSFFKVPNLTHAPVDTTVKGIFVSGYCQSPKDIPDSVSQSSGAAARAIETIVTSGEAGP